MSIRCSMEKSPFLWLRAACELFTEPVHSYEFVNLVCMPKFSRNYLIFVPLL